MPEPDDDNQNISPFPLTLGGDDDDEGLQTTAGDDGESGAPSVEDQIEELRQEIAAGNASRTAVEDFAARMLATRNADQQQQKPAEPPSFDDLPDPVKDPDAFRTELGTRINQHLQHNTQQTTTQQQRAANADKLMARFSEKYPDLAKRQALLYGVTSQKANALRAQGINDPVAFALANEDKFIDELAAQMNAELGIDDGGGVGNRSNGQRPAGRTAGVSGGTRGQGGKPPAPKAPGFNDQLLQKQQANGLI